MRLTHRSPRCDVRQFVEQHRLHVGPVQARGEILRDQDHRPPQPADRGTGRIGRKPQRDRPAQAQASAALVQLAEQSPAGLVGLGDETLHEEGPLGEQEKQGSHYGGPDQQHETLPIQGKGRGLLDGSRLVRRLCRCGRGRRNHWVR